MSAALASPTALQTPGGSLSDRPTITPTRPIPRRTLVATVVFAALLAVALYEGLSTRHSHVAPIHRTGALHVGTGARAGAPATHRKGLSSLPLAAQGPVSEALGADNPAYRVGGTGGVLAAMSPTQHLRLRFSPAGVSLTSGVTHIGLSLRAIGYGSTLAPLGQVTPSVRANRVDYARKGLSEWYVNGPLGLEQGFTIDRAPAPAQGGALTLAIALSGNAQAKLGADGQSITLSHQGRAGLRYSGLSATDASGRSLHSWLQLQGGRVLLRVDAQGARYPLRIDPFVQQGEKLTGGGEASEQGSFGFSVALSPEGSTALIGGPADSSGVGAAWVFTRSSTTWTQQGAKLTAKGTEEVGSGEFGSSVALSAEGTTTYALIGAPEDNEGIGAAWVFTRTGTTWTQQGAKLTAKSGEETGAGGFGSSVALASKEGNIAFIGADHNNSGVGAAWVFARTESKWTQQGAKLIAKEKEETGDGEFGDSVALSAEGTTALVGAGFNKEGIGAAWVFTRSKETWTQQGAILTAKSGEETGAGEFGSSVALSLNKEGSTALIGAPENKEGIGAAWVFARSGTTWTQQGAILTAKSGEEIGSGEFGTSVALSGEGTLTYALIGGPGDNKGIGAAWVFTRSGTTWTQQGAKLTAKSGEEAGAGGFGESVAISTEGTTALIGGADDNKAIGAAWVFTRTETTWAEQGPKLTATGEVGPGPTAGAGEFGFSVALSAEATTATALIGGPGDDKDLGAVWVFTRSGTTWTQQGGKLTPKSGEEIGEGGFGDSVALASKEGNTAVIGGDQDNSGVGAVWVFTRTKEAWTQQGAKLTAKTGEETGAGEFGTSVALSSEGTTALVGAPDNKEGIGAAWVFTRTKEAWTQQGAILTAKSGEETGEGRFGFSVALASTKEGNTALIGAPQNKEGIGAAWVFTRSGTTWTQQGAILTAKSGEETGAGEFGSSVALSGENSTTYALMGAPNNKEEIGGAWVFARTSTTWTQQGAILTAKSGEEIEKGQFGASIAVSSEGTTAVMGAPGDKKGIGAAWVFTRSSTTWTQQGAKLTGGDENGEGRFGDAVALSAEGTTALFGGLADSKDIGAAWTFTRTETTWSMQGEKLKGGGEFHEPEPGSLGEFGFSVALSAEGTTALIGGGMDHATGAAWVFTRSGTTWTQQGPKLIGSGETGQAEFGDSVALSANGSTALIGGPHDNAVTGAVWVFTRTEGKWSQQGEKITAKSGEEAPEGLFGASVALSTNGNTALIGAPDDNPRAGLYKDVGAVWVFTRTESTWTQQGAKLTGSGESENGEFGESVGLSSEGNTALVGAPGDHTDIGAGWVFTRTGGTWTQQGEKLTGGGESGEGQFGWSVALSPEGNTALFGGPGDHEAIGAMWVFTRSNETWTQQGEKLTGSGETGAAEFGFSVALSSEANTALSGGPQDNGGIGAAWLFTRSGATWTQLGEKLKGGGESGEGSFGDAVALPAEGNTALIGGDRDNGFIGATWVFANTSPTVTTGTPTPISQTSETLRGFVNPDGGEVTKCEFEYGTTIAYGTTVPCSPSSLGSGTSPVEVTATINGLTANSGYHFRLVAANAAGPSKGSDRAFTTLANPPTVETKPATSITETSATLNATVNPNGAETSCEFEYGTSTSYGETVPCSPSSVGSGTSPVEVTATISGLTANTPYHFRIAATNSGATSKGSDQPFATIPNPPTVETKPATSIAETSATLNGTVNPNGVPVTECKFEYATAKFFQFTSSYEASVPCAQSVGSGTKPVEVSASVNGLAANGGYRFRIVAANVPASAGPPSEGAGVTFTTLQGPPTPAPLPASEITSTTATLNASVNPNGEEVTKCEFEYGTTISYGKTEPCVQGPGSGLGPVVVGARVAKLTPGTLYHFRVVVTGVGGGPVGDADETFKTLIAAAAPTVVTGSASSIRPTSATLNATVNPNGEETSCEFEYGISTAYGATVPCTSSPGSGGSAVAVSASVTGLTAGTPYHFRISATNSVNTSKGSDATFTTTSPAHWYSNGARVEEGVIVPIISWGTLTLKTTTGGSGQVTCHTAGGGTVLNPEGEGTGLGETVAFATFDCEQTGVCPEGDTAELLPQALPWPAALGASGSVISEKTEEIKLNRACFSAGKEVSGTRFVGSLEPTSHKGTSALHPSFLEFGTAAGTLEGEGSAGAVQAKVEGSLKLFGFQGQELVATKVP